MLMKQEGKRVAFFDGFVERLYSLSFADSSYILTYKIHSQVLNDSLTPILRLSSSLAISMYNHPNHN